MRQHSVQEFIERQPEGDIIVKENEHIILGPDNANYGNHLYEIEINSFKDLQLLRLIPNNLDQNEVVEAILLDDKESLSTSRKILNNNPSVGFDIMQNGYRSCNCNMDLRNRASFKEGYQTNLDILYTGIRKSYNQNLLQLLSQHYKIDMTNDRLIHKIIIWLVRKVIIDHVPFRVWVTLGNDIIINYRGTLTLESKVKHLWAANIKIFKYGRLISKSSYVKIVCRSIVGNI